MLSDLRSRPTSPSSTDSSGHHPHPFTVQEFGALVSSALEMHSIPDNTLQLSLELTSRRASPHSPSAGPSTPSSTQRGSAALRAIKSALLRKNKSRNVPPVSPTSPPQTRGPKKMASSSVPALNTYTNSDRNTNGHVQPRALDMESSLRRSESTSRSKSRYPYRNSNSPVAQDHIRRTPENFNGKKYIKPSVSFFNLKPIPLHIPKFTKVSPKHLFAARPTAQVNGGSASNPSDNVERVFDGSSPGISEEMRSFFDDSGYEDDTLDKRNICKKGLIPNVLSVLPSRDTALDETHSKSGSVRARKENTKPLPVVPLFKECTPAQIISERSKGTNWLHSPPTSFIDRRHLQLDTLPKYPLHPYATSTRRPQSFRSNAPGQGPHNATKQIQTTRQSSSLECFDDPAKSVPLKRKSSFRACPSPYPSPASPLPPTPSPASECSNVLGEDFSDDQKRSGSIDSLEIVSWRLKRQNGHSSETSSSSSHNAYSHETPSNTSVRRRLGLGPHLHVHDSIPEGNPRFSHILSQNLSSGISRGSRMFSSTVNLTLPSPRISSPIPPLSRLASASLVSLRSLTTIGAGNQHISREANGLEAMYEADDIFYHEDDPFASLPPLPTLTPSNSHTSDESVEYHSFMPLGNDSVPTISIPDSPFGTPRHTHNRPMRFSNLSSPVVSTPPTPSSDDVPPLPSRPGKNAADNHTDSPSRVSGQRNQSMHTSRRNFFIPSVGHTRRTDARQYNRDSANLRKERSNTRVDTVERSDIHPNSSFPTRFLHPTVQRFRNLARKDSKIGLTSPGIQTQAVSGSEGSLSSIDAPRPLSSVDTDKFADSCATKGHPDPESNARITDTPTGWFTDSETETETVENVSEKTDESKEDKTVAQPHNAKDEGKTCNVCDSEVETGNGTTGDIDLGLPRPHSEFWQSSESSSNASDAEDSQTETEDDGKLETSQAWPLPPIRTVVVDEERGEGWHDLESDIEYIPQNSSVPLTPRHTIRSAKSSSSATSQMSSTRSSGAVSPHQQMLSNCQLQLIAEKLKDDVEARESSPTRYQQSCSRQSSLTSMHPDRCDSKTETHSSVSPSPASTVSTCTELQSFATCESIPEATPSSLACVVNSDDLLNQHTVRSLM